ncbi:MAG: ATP synthase subunit I [Ruminococcus sp.]|nr:ATP synthase subunit I [Ruminococcus sp.]
MSSDTENRPAGGAELMPLVGKLCKAMAAAACVCFLFTLIWGFELRNLLGFAVGGANACAGMYYLAKTVQRAVDQDKKRAKRLMLSCYGLRLAVLTALCAFGFLTGLLSVVGIIVPQLFPRILLTFDHILGINYF